MPSVYIQGPGGAPYERMFASMGIIRAKTIEEASFVCFTGGEDVDPDLYGEKALRSTHFNTLRDDFDNAAYARAKDDASLGGKPCVGVCRGGQFLNVMNGGKLWQDVDRHTNSHTIWDPHIQKEFFVSSTHHQQMIPHHSGVLVAYAGISHSKTGFGKGWSSNLDSAGIRGNKDYMAGVIPSNAKESVHPSLDVEVVWYPETKDLCFQPHPEFGVTSECKDYFINVFNRYVLEEVS